MIDNDDEEDYEGYFLRPANEYNIKEKIKLANQESFAIPTPPSPKYSSGERRVTFRAQLVDYEPDEYSDAEEEGRYAATNGVAHEGSESSPELNDRSQSKNPAGDMDEVDEDIIEELSINEPPEEDIESHVETVQDDEDQEEEEDEEQEPEDDEELDEEVTESSLDTEIHNPETASEDSSSPSKARASEEGSGSGDGQEVNYSEDSQNDDENSEERAILKEQLMRESLSYDNEGEENEDETQDQYEDDDNDDEDDSPVQAHLGKRSAKCQRKCCRFKKTVNEKLPYYNGFHSEYGLSKAELDAKQKRVEAKKKRFQERYQRKVEEQQIKAQTNEEAFATWLNKKLKSSINKYQNMYDFKGKKHKKRLSKDESEMTEVA
ncbi:probable serine/threonine-protein kinase kinX [Ochlerotatus camptorhynchus]|uniref:probable serine/threonine-protein kinase kinX n=1 Tax=Ochlerotatus camptorhynchus TaxID=644619 RepID=UPI0031D6C336